VDVCPVECIIPGKPESEWPWLYIDPDTCIDCGACVPECPYEAIFPEDEVPTAYTMKAGQYLADTKANLPDGEPLDGDVGGHNVKVENAKAPGAGFVIDLTPATPLNVAYFKEGPGYSAKG
jgi:NAD-dependent dihydropyrimidine dehydrogenase PreA subunit